MKNKKNEISRVAQMSTINANPSFTVFMQSLTVGITRGSTQFSHDIRLQIQNRLGAWINIGGWHHFTGTVITLFPTLTESEQMIEALDGRATTNSRVELRTRNGLMSNSPIIGGTITRMGVATAPVAATATSNPTLGFFDNLPIRLSSTHTGLGYIVSFQIQNNNGDWESIRVSNHSNGIFDFNFEPLERQWMAQTLGQRNSAPSRLSVQTHLRGFFIREPEIRSGTFTAPIATSASASNFTIGANATTVNLPIVINRENPLLSHDISLRSGQTVLQNFLNVTGQSITLSAATVNWIRESIGNGSENRNLNLVTITRFNHVRIRADVVSPNFTATLVGVPPILNGAPTTLDVNASVTNITGSNQVFIQRQSTVRIVMPSGFAVGQHGAVIQGYEVNLGSQSRSAEFSTETVFVDFNNVAESGDVELAVTAVDSRGNRSTWRAQINVIPYEIPALTATARRNDGFGAPSTLTLIGTFSPVIIGEQPMNGILSTTGVQYRHRIAGNNSWGGWINWVSNTNDSFEVITNPLNINLDNQQGHDIEFRVTDRFSTSNQMVSVPVGEPTLFLDPFRRAVSINGLPTGDNRLDVHGRLNADEIYAPLITQNGVRVSNEGHLHDASAVTTGVFQTARIPALAATWITSGSMSADRIGSGVLATARIPALGANWITSGLFDAARIPLGLRANTTIAGQFTVNQPGTGAGNGVRIHGTSGNIDGTNGRTELRVSGGSLLLQTAGKSFSIRTGMSVSDTANTLSLSADGVLGGSFNMSAARVGSGTMSGDRIATNTLNPNRLMGRGMYNRAGSALNWAEVLVASSVSMTAANFNGATAYVNTSSASTSNNTSPAQTGLSTQGRSNNYQVRVWMFRSLNGAIRHSWIVWSGTS